MRNASALAHARQLRNKTTDAERVLWRYLRNRQLRNYRFRRQMPIGNFIADFACVEAKLAIELDGGQHQEREAYDRWRTQKLEARGYRVLRFWDNDVLLRTQAVVEEIFNALPAPSPALPRTQGREL